MRAADFDYLLPSALVAQFPAPARDQSRLMVMSRSAQTLHHRMFSDLPEYLRPGDVLVLNDSRVIPARLQAVSESGGAVLEVFLLEMTSLNEWWTLMRPGKRARPGSSLRLIDRAHNRTRITLEVLEKNAEGHRHVRFSGTPNILDDLNELGEVPLPPYIKRQNSKNERSDQERYQTVYARQPGSVAAPTAGLHFTPALLQSLRERGVQVASLTLHVGVGTFAPVKADCLEDHIMHEERFVIPAETAELVNRAKENGRRIFAVGTTSLRVLESAGADGTIRSGQGRTGLFIYPPWQFRIVDGLLTNFHLPRSTLLMLVSAFASPGQTDGRAIMLQNYAEAIAKQYRFFSYGDAMLIL